LLPELNFYEEQIERSQMNTCHVPVCISVCKDNCWKIKTIPTKITKKLHQQTTSKCWLRAHSSWYTSSSFIA